MDFETAKGRALAFVEQGDLEQAIDSMLSDMSKVHPESSIQYETTAIALRMSEVLDPEKVKEWIDGFR